MILVPRAVEIRHFHLFCGLGGGAKGFNAGRAQVGHLHARFRCIGGIDVDAGAIADFERLAQARGTVLDLFDAEQYAAFHGTPPPEGWRPAGVEDMRRAAGGERPHILFGSAPCKGFSGLLSETRSRSAKYQALNQLALRGLWLALEAWGDDPPELVLWENVPRIQTRGRAVLDQMIRLLEAYGYAVAETVHDCGELGGLGQSRKRFLLVARHVAKVPPFLYEPARRPLRSVGDVLAAFPLPSDPAAGPMHRMRALQWRTWVRLAFVEAGSDWRSLKRLRVEDGVLADFGIAPDATWFNGALGVTPWDRPAGTVTSEARPQNGGFAVADPRIDGHAKSVQFGVRSWDEPSATVTGQMWPGCGPRSVADPRVGEAGPRFNNTFRIVRWGEASPAIAGPGGPGGQAVADPRATSDWQGHGKYTVTPFEAPAHTVIAASTTGNGAYAVADPRTGIDRGRGDHYLTARHYGVLPWSEAAGAVTANAGHDNGGWSVADPRCGWSDSAHRNKLRVTGWDAAAPTVIGATRVDSGAGSVADPRCATGPGPSLPAAKDSLVAVIRALDGTWHRPFTTLELAALQGLVQPDEFLALHGTSDTAWRERIGNAVPAPAAAAIASVMAETLLLAWSGETFALSAQPIWVQPIAVALSVQPNQETVA